MNNDARSTQEVAVVSYFMVLPFSLSPGTEKKFSKLTKPSVNTTCHHLEIRATDFAVNNRNLVVRYEETYRLCGENDIVKFCKLRRL